MSFQSLAGIDWFPSTPDKFLPEGYDLHVIRRRR